MFNFDLYNPTKVIFGKDRFSELDKLIPSDAKVLITFGGGSVIKFGTLDKVKNALGKREIYEFGGIEANPEYETLLKAVKIAKENKIDFLLAVGGGSVMDGTKFIAAAALYEGENPLELISGLQASGATKAIPLGTVVTLPATGSEVNGYAVISHRATKSKLVFASPLVFPQFSLLDPTLTFTLPKIQVANGIIDTYVHVIEQYLTEPAEARIQDRLSEGIMQTLVEIGAKTIENPQDYEARANLVWSATAAMNGMISAGVSLDWMTHMIGHELTALYGIDHAQTLAVILPSLMNVRRKAKHAKLLQYANRVWNITEGSEDEQIDNAIQKTRQFFQSLGVKTYLADYGLTAANIDEIMNQLESHNVATMFSAQGETTNSLKKIITDAIAPV